MITIIFHELGHALMTKKLGGTCHEIVLWPLGGFAICGPPNNNGGGAYNDLKVAASGPLMHIPQMIFWAILYALFNKGNMELFQPEVYIDVLMDGFVGFMSVLCCMSFWMNVFIMTFNLFVPAYPLDGGRCMAAVLIMFGFTVTTSAYATSVTAMFVACLLGFLGIISGIQEGNPNGFFTALVAAYIFMESKFLFDLTKAGRVTEHPLFSRACFDERESIREENAGIVEDKGTELGTV